MLLFLFKWILGFRNKINQAFNSGFSLSLSPVLYSLKDNYDQATRRDDVKAIVVTGKSEEIIMPKIEMEKE